MDDLINLFPSNHECFNPKIRDDFVKMCAKKVPKNSKILDVSSGTKPYQQYFGHCHYTSHEFEGNVNIKDTFRGEAEKQHDIYSPIDSIPMPNNEYDCIICTEVFEHIPEPIRAMGEFVRLCKPGGQILITAPFTSGIHQEPYHFYSGFSPFFYTFLKEKYNLDIIDFKSQGDTFLLQNQEINRTLSHIHPTIFKNSELYRTYQQIRHFLHLYTLQMSDDSKVNHEMTEVNDFNRFTIGYCVLFQKKIN